MAKKLISVLAAAGLVAGALIASPAHAQSAAEVPETPNIVDPKGDANYLNDQGGLCFQGTCTPYFGDNSLPQSVGTVSDILAVWFTNDAEFINAHILTDAAPPASTPLFFRVQVDPGEGSNCLWFQAFFASAQDPSGTTPTGASLRDTCSTGLGTQEGELIVETVDDDGLTTIKIPRDLYPTFTDDSTLKTPSAHVRNFIGGAVTAPQIENTKPGTDYLITGGETAEESPKASKPKPKPKKKGKKGKKGKPKSAACAAFTPGEAGKDQPSVTVTDAATEEAPVEQAVTLAGSVADFTPTDPSTAFFNVQVDSANPDAGLYVLFEFDTRRDYDLELLHPDGSYAARSHGFNPVAEDPGDGTQADLSNTGHGGETTDSSEALIGIKTADCGGWTVEALNWLGEGGDFAIKLWLGEIQNDPQAEGEEPPG